MAERHCKTCGQPFKAPPSSRQKYCGVPCMRIAAPTRRHGYSERVENTIWIRMRNRCNNPKNADYPNYGGRGIKVCERWEVFENFLADMGDRPGGPEITLDRIDNSKDYEPSNCRWATKVEQSRNRRGCYTPEQDAKIRAMIDAGCNFTTIASALGKSHGAVSSRAYRLGLCSGQPPTRPDYAARTPSQHPSTDRGGAA